MRKILFLIIVILLIVGTFIVMNNGLKFAGLEINSVSGIYSLGTNLEDKIKQATELTSVTYNTANKGLNDSLKDLKQKREEYENRINSIGAETLAEMLTTNRHEMQYIWTKVGKFATDNGVRLTLNLRTSSSGLNGAKDLDFTVEGAYRNITNFIYTLEGDDDLQFKIEDFKLIPITVSQGNGASVSRLQATFSVKGLNIVLG